MSELSNDNLNELLKNIKPSIITPKLSEISSAGNDKKVKMVANIIVQQMAEDYNSSDQYKVPKYIMHNGKTTAVRMLNIEPLLMGVWPTMSLCLLHLSYGEQTTLIEALYPKSTQLAAKQFAAVFTKTGEPSGEKIDVHESDEVVEKLDSANAGIAMILAMMQEDGYRHPHPDKINIQLDDMNDLVKEENQKKLFKYASKRAKDAYKARDKGQSL